MMKKFKEWLRYRETATTTANVANYSQPLGGGYAGSPVLNDDDEFVGSDSQKQAEKCGLAMCPHQLTTGMKSTDKRITNQRLRNTEKKSK